MDAKEHAEIWSRAAQVVRAMDPRQQMHAQQNLTGGVNQQSMLGPFSQQDAAAWNAFGAAAAVLSAIAKEYADAAAQEAAVRGQSNLTEGSLSP